MSFIVSNFSLQFVHQKINPQISNWHLPVSPRAYAKIHLSPILTREKWILTVDNFSKKTCLKRVVLFLNCYPISRIKTETCNAVLRKLLHKTCRELRVRKHRRPWGGWAGFKHLRDCFRNWRKTPFNKRGAARRAPLHPPGVPPLWHSLLASRVTYSSTNRPQLSPWKN